ncbi:unnamed protein product [Agarophyton chilense]|eukprot:gb/GEZJ01002836.1/.p2 GENE.gb/GEZJ01002836.1/~~gb/GEZJ01002836.1/.p2  ORF type:complete len:394 (-),score=85.36 gb/GEZJ01002836.1/:680-1771(-)
MAAPSSQPAFPPIHLHCASAPDKSLSPDAEMERAKVVMSSSPRMPAVGYFGARYGHKWYADIVALPHNAIRRQLCDAFIIANALGKLQLDVADADLARVYAWLGTLEAFVRAVFNAEARFVFPLIDANLQKATTSDGKPACLPELISVRGRVNAQQRIFELLHTARNTRDVATGETVAKINALRYALDQFGANVLDYFAAIERFAPKLFKKALRNGQRQQIKLENKMFDFVHRHQHGSILAALLMQCIESRTTRQQFVDRNLKKKQRVQFIIDVKRVENTHMTLAPAFDDAASRYEKRFNVHKFLQHYDAQGDSKLTLAMLGETDMNAESAQLIVDNKSPLEEDDSSRGVALDDDVLEVYAEA